MQIYVPQIMIRKFHIMETQDPVNIPMGIYGEFEVVKRRRGIITQELKFRNIITDYGLQKLASIDNYPILDSKGAINYCHLGTGSTTPTSTDTTLEAHGGSSAYKSYSTCEGAYGSGGDRYAKITWEFSLSDAVGIWTELGLSNSNSTTASMFCRMLFKDDDGNPVSVEKTGDDTLTVIYYLHFVRSSDTPTTNQIIVDSTTITVESLILNQCLYQLARGNVAKLNTSSYLYYATRLGTGTDELSITQEACRTPINTQPTLYQAAAYVAGTFYREFVFEWAATVTGDIAEAVYVFASNSSSGYYYYTIPFVAMRFTPTISKMDTTNKIRLRPRITWARAS